MKPRKLILELGFDWGALEERRGLRALQSSLVMKRAGRPGKIVSPCNPSDIRVDDRLGFRIFDFTRPSDSCPGALDHMAPRPLALQVWFGSSSLGQTAFSPLKIGGNQLSVINSMSFRCTEMRSVAYQVGFGWNVYWPGRFWVNDSKPKKYFRIKTTGRFELRALLTVGVLNEPARVYYVDPEVVVGCADTGC